MAIRIRMVNGTTVALCAAKTEWRKGDMYLDDYAHHALTTKFGLDWESEGILKNASTDSILVAIIKDEESKGLK